MVDFNLSDKIEMSEFMLNEEVIKKEHICQFIKSLKEEIPQFVYYENDEWDLHGVIDSLIGNKFG